MIARLNAAPPDLIRHLTGTEERALINCTARCCSLKCRLCASSNFQYQHKLGVPTLEPGRRNRVRDSRAVQPRQLAGRAGHRWAAADCRQLAHCPLRLRCAALHASGGRPTQMKNTWDDYFQAEAESLHEPNSLVEVNVWLGGSHHSFHQHIISYCRCVSRHFSALPCTVSRLGPGFILT